MGSSANPGEAQKWPFKNDVSKFEHATHDEIVCSRQCQLTLSSGLPELKNVNIAAYDIA